MNAHTTDFTTSAARQAWLEAATTQLRERFGSLSMPAPDNVRVSIGWPRGGRGNTSGSIEKARPFVRVIMNRWELCDGHQHSALEHEEW